MRGTDGVGGRRERIGAWPRRRCIWGVVGGVWEGMWCVVLVVVWRYFSGSVGDEVESTQEGSASQLEV